MLKRFLGFLVAGSILAAFGYLFYLNPSVAELHLSAERSYALPLPLLLLLAFLAGGAVVFALALLRETQWTLAEMRRKRRERLEEERRSAVATGRLLQWEGRPEQARSVIRRRRRFAEPLEASLVLAEAALESARPEEARDLLEEARTRHPDHPQLLAQLATAYSRLGQPALATAALEQAAVREPNSPRLLAALRDCYVEERRWTDALRSEEALLSALRAPEHVLEEQPRLWGLRYQAALAADGEASVAEDLRRIVARQPTFLPAVLMLGDRLRALGRGRQAASVWVRAATTRPLPVLLERIESLYLEWNRPKRMIALYQKLLGRRDSATLRVAFARFLLARGEPEEAAGVLENTPQREDGRADVQVMWAEIHRSRGDIRPAIDALRRALAIEPPCPYACRICGRREPAWAARCPGCGTWDGLDAA